jgi:hypothetical protein
VQRITLGTVSGEPIEGYWSVDFGRPPAPGSELLLASNASAADLRVLLESLPGAGRLETSRRSLVPGLDGGLSGYAWDVTFGTRTGDQPRIYLDPSPHFAPWPLMTEAAPSPIVDYSVRLSVTEVKKGARAGRQIVLREAVEGTRYAINVAAENSVGRGPATWNGGRIGRDTNNGGAGAMPLSAVASAKAGPPPAVEAVAISPHELSIALPAGADGHGLAIESYDVEVVRVSSLADAATLTSPA